MIIDTVNKTITPAGEDLGTIVAELQVMFPNNEWKAYRIYNPIVTITEKEYINPINPYPYFPVIPSYPNPYYEIPCTNPYIITCEDTSPHLLDSTAQHSTRVIHLGNTNYRA